MEDESLIEEFAEESFELLDEAEAAILNVQKNYDEESSYKAVYRVLHTIKGGAGMLGLNDLQRNVHNIEEYLESIGPKAFSSEENIDYFLSSLDKIRAYFNQAGETLNIETPPQEDVLEAKQKENRENNKESQGDKQINKTEGDLKNLPVKEPLSLEMSLLYVIADEESFLELVKKEITSAHLNVKCFTSPLDVLEILKNGSEQEPDLILSNIHTPKIKGLDFLQELNRLRIDIPVILISHMADKNSCIMAINLGVEAIFEKPFEIYNIEQSILKTIARRKAKKLIRRSMKLIFYQYSDIKKYLLTNGHDQALEVFDEEFKNLLTSLKELDRIDFIKPNSTLGEY